MLVICGTISVVFNWQATGAKANREALYLDPTHRDRWEKLSRSFLERALERMQAWHGLKGGDWYGIGHWGCSVVRMRRLSDSSSQTTLTHISSRAFV